MKNLLVCTLLFASAFTLNAQVANTRVYAAEKLAKVKEKALIYDSTPSLVP